MLTTTELVKKALDVLDNNWSNISTELSNQIVRLPENSEYPIYTEYGDLVGVGNERNKRGSSIHQRRGRVSGSEVYSQRFSAKH